MKCAWQAYLRLLPPWIRQQVDNRSREELQELRLRRDRPPELIKGSCSEFLDRNTTTDDLNYCINAASQYSPWTSATVSSGYITAPGGHRVGICGDVAIANGCVNTISSLSSLCIRVSRDFPGISLQAAGISGSVLIIGRPGCGKTTLLRDLIRQRSNSGFGAVAVVDQRRELFPQAEGAYCYSPGLRTEVLSGCQKAAGIEMMIRTMNPQWVAVDEITAAEDCQALLQGLWCGVQVLATAHAGNLEEFLHRPVYRPLVESAVFEHIIVMKPDKSWTMERMNI